MQRSSKTECRWRVQPAGRVEVGAERLLGDHPGALAEPERADLLDRSRRRLRGQREVDRGGRPRRRAPPALPRSPRPAPRTRRPRRRTAATRRTGPRPRESSDLAAGAVDRLPRQLAELLDVDRFARRADDPEALRHQAHLGEVEHPRQQLALRQVAGRPEEDDHLVLGDLGGRFRLDRGCGGDAHALRLTDARRWPRAPSGLCWTPPMASGKTRRRRRPRAAGPGRAALLARHLGVGAGRGRQPSTASSCGTSARCRPRSSRRCPMSGC